jgi:hypothetical protein
LSERCQPGLHRGRERAPLVVEIVQLSWIVLQVIQLRAWSVHVLEPAGSERLQLAPAKPPRIHGFRVRLQLVVRDVPFHQRQQADAVHWRRRDSDRIEHGGHHIDQPHERSYAPRRDTGYPDDQGHTDSALIDQNSVAILTMIAERLAMIGGNHHQRVVR